MKVSVITISKNAESLIEKTILSVLEQTYANLEYIIIDGNSTDGTQKIIEKYNEDIAIYISEADSGLYDAMNKGILNATGEIVIFLNAGDYYISKDVIKFALSKMNFSQANLFFGRFIWNDPMECNIILSDHSWVRYTWDLMKSNFPHPATFYKRDLFEKLGQFDTSYQILSDYEWNIRALVKHKISFQYIDIAMAVFFADGISNNESNADKRIKEANRLNSTYFNRNWLNLLNLEKSDSILKKYQKKILARIYECKLNRVY